MNAIPPVPIWVGSGVENTRESVVADGGTLGALHITLSVAPGGSVTRTFTVRLNESPTSLACTVASGATTCADTNNAHNVSLVAGDRLTLNSTVTGGTAASTNVSVAVLWKPTTTDHTLWLGSTSNTIANTTAFAFPFGISNATESVTYMAAAVGGTAQNLYVWCNGTVAAGTRVFTLRDEVANTALTCTMNVGESTCHDTVNTATITQLDRVDLGYTVTSTPGSVTCGYGLVFVPTTAGQYVVGVNPTTGASSGTTFEAILGQGGTRHDTAETMPIQQAGLASTFGTIAVKQLAATGSGVTRTYTLRDAGDTALTCQIGGNSATTCTGTASVGVADDDLLDTSMVVTGGTGSTTTPLISYGATYTGAFP